LNNTTEQLYTEYTNLLQKAADIHHAAAVLEWDQEVYMPPKGAYFRGRQLATLAGQAHELLTGDKLESLLRELLQSTGLNDVERCNVQRSYEDFEKNKKLSPEFVEELSRQTSECFNAWIEARNANDYKIFAPSLARMITLKRKQAELYGYKQHPYDALLDEYEKGATVAMLDPIFGEIREKFPSLLQKIKAAQQVSDECFYRHFPKEDQWNFGIEVLTKMGFDFDAGRQDYSVHPFTTSFSASDVRLTTRVDEDNFASMLWSCIHEAGHGLYEQGLPEQQYGLPLGAAASLSIHESQSRLWENCAGRGLDFWTFFYPRLQQYFPEQLSDVSLESFYKAINKVEPSLIRTEADEVTYHFHVMIRYEIEKGLMDGSLKPEELPAKWSEMYSRYLGVTPADDKTGVLQDVHWSHGSFGYFPTYTLGSFYAIQFFDQAERDIKGLPEQIVNGELTPLLQWLREKVHKHGRRYYSDDLCKLITGKGLDPAVFFEYARKKYSRIYGFELTT
jgi:carboxypeptidase Taq